MHRLVHVCKPSTSLGRGAETTTRTSSTYYNPDHKSSRGFIRLYMHALCLRNTRRSRLNSLSCSLSTASRVFMFALFQNIANILKCGVFLRDSPSPGSLLSGQLRIPYHNACVVRISHRTGSETSRIGLRHDAFFY